MKKITLILAAAFAAFACQKEIQPVVEVQQELTAPEGYKVLVLSVDANKCAIADDGTSAWEAGDILAVYDGTEICQFSLTEGQGTSSAKFTGIVNASATDLTAVYPYDAASLDAGVFSVNVPAVQTIATRSYGVASASCTVASPALSFTAASAVVRFTAPSGADKVIFHGGKGAGLATDSDQVEVALPNTDGGVYEASLNAGTYGMFTAFVHKNNKFYAKEGASQLVLTAGEIKPLGTINPTEEAVLIYTKEDLDAFAASPSTSAYLCADIDFNGGAFTPVAEFAKTFNGQNYNLYKFYMSFTSTESGVLNEGFFTKLNGATVKNLVIGEYYDTTSWSDLSGMQIGAHSSATSINAGALAGEIAGSTISNVKSYAYVNNGGDNTKPANLGGLVGIATGDASAILNCAVDMDFDYNGSSSGESVAGGIIAFDYAGSTIRNCVKSGYLKVTNSGYHYCGGIIGCQDSSAATTVEDCTNNGQIQSQASFSSDFYFGGIAASMNSSSSVISGCKNNVRFEIQPATIGTNGYIAGIAAQTAGTVEDCTNEYEIAVSTSQTAASAYIGGIVAKAASTSLIKDCDNKGPVTAGYTTVAAKEFTHYLGGIAAVSSGQIEGCTNVAEIIRNSSKNNGISYFGGICGSFDGASVYGCTNTGNVTEKQANKPQYLGGIIGYLGNNLSMISDCTVSDCTIVPGRKVKNNFAGGIVGYINNAAANPNVNFEGCKVNCSCINLGETTNAAVGMIIGCVMYSASNGFTCGSAAKPVLVKGVYGCSSIALTSSNYASYLIGQGYVTGDVNVTTGGVGSCITFNADYWN